MNDCEERTAEAIVEAHDDNPDSENAQSLAPERG